MSNPDPRIDRTASIGFERAAAAYERGRPEYPEAAIRRLVEALRIGKESRVVELGAGTGKLTRAVARTGAEIVAVEPVDAMRRKLSAIVPQVSVLDGTAEAIPLSDSSVDAVIVAQAFHWFRVGRALAEIHRVLKPNGGVGLIWNVRDESVDWVRRLTAIIEPHETGVPQYRSMEWKREFDAAGGFSPLQTAQEAHDHCVTADEIVDRVASISFIAALSEPARRAVLDEVRELVRTHRETRNRPQIDLPYRTDLYWCWRR